MELGMTLDLAAPGLASDTLVEKASLSGMKYAFIPFASDENVSSGAAREARRLITLCRRHGLEPICDLSPTSLSALGVRDGAELLRFDLDYIRLGKGFDIRQAVELSNFFHVVFNASTISEADIADWRSAGADFSHFAACHNYYPKPLTGLAIEDVAATNQRLRALGFQVMGFVSGDRELRGPLHEGLPTVEAHRGDAGAKLVLDMLELGQAGCDVVLVGDPDVTDGVWRRIAGLSQGIIDLRAELAEPFSSLFGRVQHDRPDSSPWIVRSQESRRWEDAPQPPEAQGQEEQEAAPGDILMSTAAYGRYAGELEIARQSFRIDPRDAAIGHVVEEDLPFLPYIRAGAGFRLVRG